MKRTAQKITYHGRTGKALIHTAKSGRRYTMVRAVGGGVKRLYEGSRYSTGKGQTKRLKLR